MRPSKWANVPFFVLFVFRDASRKKCWWPFLLVEVTYYIFGVIIIIWSKDIGIWWFATGLSLSYMQLTSLYLSHQHPILGHRCSSERAVPLKRIRASAPRVLVLTMVSQLALCCVQQTASCAPESSLLPQWWPHHCSIQLFICHLLFPVNIEHHLQ